jgi:MinD-like ATPase involved in chromosome partitioning or flagellar assembly
MIKMINLKPSRVTIFAGHYGSGKTTVAVNYAAWLAQSGKRVVIADLDIVNPYFRANDAATRLSGVEIISSAYAGSGLDAPAMPPEAARIFDDKGLYAVIDVGGDDRGALAIGQYAERLADCDASMLAVINMYRPMTREQGETAEIIREVERASRVKCAGIVNNSNLARETTARHVLDSVGYADGVSREIGAAIAFTSVSSAIAGRLYDKIADIFPMTLIDFLPF